MKWRGTNLLVAASRQSAASTSFNYRRSPETPLQRGLLAFTLIELITVIVIIGIMTALIIPEMRGTYEDALLRSTSRDLVNVFELASSRAISLNQLHRVQIDRVTGNFLVERQVSNGAVEEFVPLTEVAGGKGELDKRISIEILRPEDAPSETDLGPANEAPLLPDVISFYPDGTADAAMIVLQDRSGVRLGLKLNPTTARIHILDLEHQ